LVYKTHNKMHYAPNSSLNFTMYKTTKQTACTYIYHISDLMWYRKWVHPGEKCICMDIQNSDTACAIWEIWLGWYMLTYLLHGAESFL